MSDYVQQKSWFSRNWIWVVPVSGCFMIILLVVFGIGAAVFGVTKFIKGSEPYEYALAQAQEHPRVVEILGEPIEPNGIMQGTISFKNNRGEADIRIPVKGPRGNAWIIVKAEKYDDEWDYDELYIEIKETGEQINLLSKSLEGI